MLLVCYTSYNINNPCKRILFLTFYDVKLHFSYVSLYLINFFFKCLCVSCLGIHTNIIHIIIRCAVLRHLVKCHLNWMLSTQMLVSPICLDPSFFLHNTPITWCELFSIFVYVKKIFLNRFIFFLDIVNWQWTNVMKTR